MIPFSTVDVVKQLHARLGYTVCDNGLAYPRIVENAKQADLRCLMTG